MNQKMSFSRSVLGQSLVLVGLIIALQTSVSFADSTLSSMKLLPGFQAERIYAVPNDQGSWVSLTYDPQGRLYSSD